MILIDATGHVLELLISHFKFETIFKKHIYIGDRHHFSFFLYFIKPTLRYFSKLLGAALPFRLLLARLQADFRLLGMW